MKRMNQLLRLLMVLATVTLPGCATMPLSNDPGALGTLIVDGDNAYLNQVRVTRRATVHDGDSVTTGAGTSAKILLRVGGYVQLDEDTDPLFSFISEGACILVRLAQGQIFIDAKRICIEDDQIAANLGSRVNLWTDHATSVLTVVSGHVDVTRPTAATLGNAERYVAQRGSGRVQSRLTTDELRATTAWTTRYFRTAPPPSPPPPPPPPTPDTGWCCSNGSVFSATVTQCTRRHGTFRQDEASAAAACRRVQPVDTSPVPAHGWCCSNGSVFSATATECTRRHGTLEQDEASAVAACRRLQPVETVPVPAPPGWCCSNGRLFEANQKACRAQHGRYYDDQREATRSCVPPVQ